MFYEGCTAFEVNAYRELESETFDFGTGEMRMEGLLGSEDAYYEMDLQELEERRQEKEQEYYNRPLTIENNIKRVNKLYKRKEIDQKKLRDLSKITFWFVEDKGDYCKKHYYSRARKVLRNLSNKRVRSYKGEISNGSHYKKIYDFYWNLF